MDTTEQNATPEKQPASSKSFIDKLFEPVDNATIVLMRIAFGAIMFWETWRYIGYDWIKPSFIDPRFNFPFLGFGWLSPLPGPGMYMLFFTLGILAVLIAIGLWYRVSITLFFLGFSYVFLLDRTYYLNHFYLLCLLSFLMIFIPAHRDLSFDSRNNPSLRSKQAPAWALWLLRFQIAIPYFFGGVAKLNNDWLFRLEPIGTWLKDTTDFPVIGPWLGTESAAYFFSWSGTVFDLVIVPLLLWPRTRKVAFAAALMFHLTNARLFHIGIFPWFMIVATTLYFPPDWPRRTRFWPKEDKRAAKKTRSRKAKKGAKTPVPPVETATQPNLSPQRQQVIAGLLAAYVTFQLFMPLRQFLYPGNASWTGEGHMFSWRMKLTRKISEVRFLLTDPDTKQEWEVDPRTLIGRRQSTALTDPQTIHQFAQFLHDEYREQGHERVEVRVDAKLNLNSSPPRVLIDPNVDLAAEPRNLSPKKWIYPQHEAPLVEREPVEPETPEKRAAGR